MAQSGPSVNDPAKTFWQTLPALWSSSLSRRSRSSYSTLPWPWKGRSARECFTNSVQKLIAAILTGNFSSRRSSSEGRRTALAKVANTRTMHQNNFGNGVPMVMDEELAKTNSNEAWGELSKDDSNASQQRNECSVESCFVRKAKNGLWNGHLDFVTICSQEFHKSFDTRWSCGLGHMRFGFWRPFRQVTLGSFHGSASRNYPGVVHHAIHQKLNIETCPNIDVLHVMSHKSEWVWNGSLAISNWNGRSCLMHFSFFKSMAKFALKL